MNIFHSPSPYPFGLDISDFTLRLVQLDLKGHYPVIQTLSRILVPPGFIKGGEIKNKEGVINLLHDLTKKTIFGKLSSKEVVTALPEPKTFVKLLDVTGEELLTNEIIEDEIKKNIPFSLNDIYYDWQLISKQEKKISYSSKRTEDKLDEARNKVLIGVTQKDIARQYYNLLKDAGFYPVTFEVEPVAITRSLFPIFSPYTKRTETFPEKKKTQVVIDLGASRSTFIAYSQGTILFTASLPVSSRKATKVIAEKLNIKESKANAAKIIYGLDKKVATGVIAKSLEQMINDLVDKIKKSLKYLAASYPDFNNIECIYLCGSGAQIKGISEELSKGLKIETKLANIFVNLKMDSKTENKYLSEELSVPHKAKLVNPKLERNQKIKQRFSLTFATAVGLALRGIHVDEI